MDKQSVGELISKTKGFQDMFASPVLSRLFGFKSTKKTPIDSSEPQTDEYKRTINNKDPNFSTIGDGPTKVLKSGDSEADILGKMYNFMVQDYLLEEKQSKSDEKYRKQLMDQKDRFTNELVMALTGKKAPAGKRSGTPTNFGKLAKIGVMGAGALGTFFLAEKALANVDWKSLLPDLPKGLAENFNIGTSTKTPTTIDVGNVSNLSDLVGKLESGGDYNKMVIPTGKGIKPEKPITEMTLDEVSSLQEKMKKSGDYPSTAVGKYQYLQGTLKGVAKQENLDTSKEKFTPEIQERLFKRTLVNRGLEDYKSGKISKEQFQNNLAMEFASIPVTTDIHRPAGKGYAAKNIKVGESYYAGVGGNKSLVKPEVVAKLLEDLKSPTVSMQPTESKIDATDNKFKETQKIKKSMTSGSSSTTAVINQTNNNYSGDTNLIVSTDNENNWPAILAKQFPIYR